MVRSRRTSKCGRTQNESVRRRGGQVANENAKKRLEWMSSFDLSTPEGVSAFLRAVIQKTWCGDLGSRQTGALNGSLRLLFECVEFPQLQEKVVELEKLMKEKRT